MREWMPAEDRLALLPMECMVYRFLHPAEQSDRQLPMQNLIFCKLLSSSRQQLLVVLWIHGDIEQTHFEQNHLLQIITGTGLIFSSSISIFFRVINSYKVEELPLE